MITSAKCISLYHPTSDNALNSHVNKKERKKEEEENETLLNGVSTDPKVQLQRLYFSISGHHTELKLLVSSHLKSSSFFFLFSFLEPTVCQFCSDQVISVPDARTKTVAHVKDLMSSVRQEKA